jgi:hypothetical protein
MHGFLRDIAAIRRSKPRRRRASSASRHRRAPGACGTVARTAVRAGEPSFRTQRRIASLRGGPEGGGAPGLGHSEGREASPSPTGNYIPHSALVANRHPYAARSTKKWPECGMRNPGGCRSKCGATAKRAGANRVPRGGQPLPQPLPAAGRGDCRCLRRRAGRIRLLALTPRRSDIWSPLR